ncbi:MAG TPA: glycosyltransferase family 4 protein [Thermoanaerobaculia bacterium]|nr:glycosyltransferase family 4 protein [Thermoanaerobaculia bacterium]
MRLLFLTENYPPDRGGMSESCDRIVRGLARHGARLDVVHFDRRAATTSHRTTSFGSLTRVAAEADAAHTVNLLWNRMWGGLQPAHGRAEARPHIVVAFGGYMPLLCAPAFAAWMHLPLITLIRGNELDAGLFDPRRRPLLDDALRRSAAVCTVTTAQAEKIAALYPGVTTHVVPNGIDFELWQPAPVDAARARLRTDRRVLGLFGHLKRKKGVPFFADALQRSGVADRFHLLLIGELEEPLGIEHTLLPPLDRLELIPYYLASDLVVLPSHYDGFPNVLIEAAALGRPLLASATGGMRDLLTDGESAFLFHPGHDHSCREAIIRAAEAENATLQRMGARAAEAARLHCDARRESATYMEVFHATTARLSHDAHAVRLQG